MKNSFLLNGLIGLSVVSTALTQPKPEPGLPSISVPDGFMVSEAVKQGLIAYPMFAAYDERGRLFVAESSGKNIKGAAMAEAPECRIRMLEDTDGDGVFDSSTVFADKVGIPMGVLCYQGSVYVATPPDFIRLQDTNNDGVTDVREVLLHGWNVRGTASLHGPFLGPDGLLYLTDGRHGFDIKTKEGTNYKGLASRIWRCRPDGTQLEWFAGGGFDNPVEIVFNPEGEMFGTMTYFTNPKNGERDALLHFIEGGVYSKWHPSVSEFQLTGDLMPPMTRFARIAPAGLMEYRGTTFGPEYRHNLFSAQFNTHRIQRHVLAANGSTFKTTDEDFVVSTHPDFHPTDVMEAPDGSMLVVDTGGWYVDQCPLSRITRPEFRGGLYRVRKIGARPPADSIGADIDWKSLSADKLTDLLADPRLIVHEQAIEQLVLKGNSAVTELTRLRKQAFAAETRSAVIWILYRIGTAPALAAVRDALDDSLPQVRVAALRALGQGRDKGALEKIHALLESDSAPVRRAAATALGRIGETRSNGPLINAAARKTDRFEDHAIVHALIRNFSRLANRDIRSSAQQLGRLPPGSARAALIAFDQMLGSTLQQEHVLPMLTHPDARVREAAVWVFTHHPDWAPAIVEHLKGKLFARKLAADEFPGIEKLLESFSHHPDVQTLIKDVAVDAQLTFQRHRVVFDAIQKSDAPKFPGQWIAALKSGLIHTNDTIREISIQVVESRALPGFEDFLTRIADSDSREDLRFKAFGILAAMDQLKSKQLSYLIDLLKPEVPASKRSGAAAAISRAKLITGQLLTLATNTLPQADPITLPSLLEPFRGSTNKLVGVLLVETLLANQQMWDYVNPRMISALLESFPGDVKAQGKILIGNLEKAQSDRVGRLKDLEPLLAGGDVGRGRQMFFNLKSQCAACHAIGNEGGNLGPDLTSIGKIRSGLDILEAIVFPSASFVPGYEPMKINTKKDLHSGNIVAQTRDSVVLRLNATTEMRIARKDIESINPGEVSVMPEGLDKVLTHSELRDLLAFLQSLNGEQWLQPKIIGPKARITVPAANPKPKPATRPATGS